jgi:hypothetical protein
VILLLVNKLTGEFYRRGCLSRNNFYFKHFFKSHVAQTGKIRSAYKSLVGKPEGNGSHKKPRCRRVDNIKTDLTDMCCENANSIHLV